MTKYERDYLSEKERRLLNARWGVVDYLVLIILAAVLLAAYFGLLPGGGS